MENQTTVLPDTESTETIPSSPRSLLADGTVYVANIVNFRVRRISPDGTITTVAGNGIDGGIDFNDDDGDGGQATDATLSLVVSVALSPAGDILYIADNLNNRVRQVDLGTGVITNFAGVGWVGFTSVLTGSGASGFSGDGGSAQDATFRGIGGKETG
jgi:sugar lactone lactonase YvrE